MRAGAAGIKLKIEDLWYSIYPISPAVIPKVSLIPVSHFLGGSVIFIPLKAGLIHSSYCHDRKKWKQYPNPLDKSACNNQRAGRDAYSGLDRMDAAAVFRPNG